MAAITLLLLVATLALTLPGRAEPSHAQDSYAGATERVLLSTLGQAEAAESTTLANHDAEIQFRGPSYAPGYIITRVDIKFTGPANSASDLPFVALRNHVGTEATLTGSATDLGGNTYTFTPAAPVRITGSVRYRIRIEGGTMSLAQTSSDQVETGTKHQWNGFFSGYFRSHDSTGDTSSLSNGNSYMYSIRGRVVQPTVTYVSNTGQTTTGNESMRGEDRAQSFTTGSDPAGYPLRSVYVSTRDTSISSFEGFSASATPKLAIHRGSAAGPNVADLPKQLAIWAPDYILDTPVTLQPSTTYWVVAEAGPGDWYRAGTAEDSGAAAGWSIGNNHEFRTDGNTRAFTQSQSEGALKVEINGPGTNTPATGQPAITAPVLRVPATLAVDLSGITDTTDGVADIASTVRYRWQRFASDGMTLRQDYIGTHPTYTLTDADVGRTIKVIVSFEDDNGFSEGPLTSDATTAVWQCPEPDLQGGATLIEGPRRVGIESYTVSTEGYHGYRDILFREHGTLDDDTFSTTATPTGYTIDAIEKTITSIWLNLDKALAAADKQSLALHVCEDHYALSDFAPGAGTLHGYFIRSEQDWSSLPEVTFHISEDLVAPSFAEAWGGGTSLVIAFSEKLRPATSLSHNSFTVTRGANDDTVTLSSVAPTISGNTVELTLSDAITASDTNIKVSYNKPNAGSENRIADLVGNEAASFSGQPVVNLPADSVAPTLSPSNPATLASDGKTLTLTMNEAMKTDSLPTSTAFTVEATPSGGSEAEVHLDATTPVEVSGSAVTLNLGTPIAHNDINVKVSYTVPGSGGKLQDRAGNDLASFTDQIVINNSAIPRVGIEALHDDATPVIALPRFRFTASTAPSADLDLNLKMTQTGEHFSLAPVTIDAHNTTVEHETVGFVSTINEINEDGTATITVVGGDDHLPMVAPRNSATVEAKLPSTGPSVWVSHQQLAYSATEGEPFSIGVVFHAGEGVAQPRESFTILLFTEPGTAQHPADYDEISINAPVTPGDWTATSGGGYTYTHVQPIVIHDDALYELEAETFQAYMKASQGVSNKVVIPHRDDPDGTATITITGINRLRILEIEPASTATGGYYGDGDTIQIKVTFNGNVTVDTTGGTPQFEFELGGETRHAAYASRSGTSDLIFNYTVTTADRDDHDGISWTANSLDPNNAAIHSTHLDVNQQVAATLTHVAQAPLSDHKVDTRKPQLESAEVDRTTLTLNYSEDLKTTAPPNDAFTVSVDGGAGANPTHVAIAGKVVTLALASAVGHDQTATVSYAYPGQNANPLEDLSGKEADPFGNVSVDQASDLINFRATPGDRQVLLQWNRLNDTELTRYQYRYMSTADTGWNPDWTDIPGSNASTTSFTATNLTNGIQYTFQVRPVYTRSGQTEHGKEGEAKSAPRGALSVPTGLAAAPAGTGEITLNWDDPNDITITGYQYRYQTPSDTGWNPDWQDIPGSDATTTSHTLSNLAWQVLHTFELRAVRGSTAGPPSAQAQATPPGDATRPSVVRELRAVVLSNSRVQLYFRGPARPGDAPLTGFEYRYADSTPVPETVSWQTASPSQASNRSISISGLDGGTLYTFEVRAVNANGKQGPATRVQATTSATPAATTPSAPGSLTATPGTPYTTLVSIDDPFSDDTLPARVALVDVTLQWEPSADHGNAVIHYVYRYAEGSTVPSSEPWQFATSHSSSDELEFTVTQLDADTSYTLEVAAQARNGDTGDPHSVQIRTPEYPGPHYTLSAPGSVDEDETFTITVERSNRNDGESSALVEIRGPGDKDVTILAVEFGTEDDSATANHVLPDDDQTTTDRKIRIRIGHVGLSTENTYSVEWHTVEINNITTQ